MYSFANTAPYPGSLSLGNNNHLFSSFHYKKSATLLKFLANSSPGFPKILKQSSPFAPANPWISVQSLRFKSGNQSRTNQWQVVDLVQFALQTQRVEFGLETSGRVVDTLRTWLPRGRVRQAFPSRHGHPESHSCRILVHQQWAQPESWARQLVTTSWTHWEQTCQSHYWTSCGLPLLRGLRRSCL